MYILMFDDDSVGDGGDRYLSQGLGSIKSLMIEEIILLLQNFSSFFWASLLMCKEVQFFYFSKKGHLFLGCIKYLNRELLAGQQYFAMLDLQSRP